MATVGGVRFTGGMRQVASAWRSVRRQAGDAGPGTGWWGSVNLLFVEIAPGPDPGGAVHRTLKLAAALQKEGVGVRLLLLSAGLEADRVSAEYGIASGSIDWVPCLNRRFHVAAPHFGTIMRRAAAVDLVCLSSFLWGAAPWAWLAARWAGKPWVVSPMGVLPYFGRSMLAKRGAHALFGRQLLNGAAAVVAVTALEAQALRRLLAPNVAIPIVPNGIDLDAAAAAGERGESGHEAYALYLGRLDVVKGIDLLLRAIASARTLSGATLPLVIVGDGPQHRALEDLSMSLGLQSLVRFCGTVAGRAKYTLLRNARFVVIPSRRDAMTQVALEAGLAGRPLLLSRACGFHEAFECGGALAVDPSIDSLADGWQRMLLQADNWDLMGSKLQTLVRERYSWRAVGRTFLQIADVAVANR